MIIIQISSQWTLVTTLNLVQHETVLHFSCLYLSNSWGQISSKIPQQKPAERKIDRRYVCSLFPFEIEALNSETTDYNFECELINDGKIIKSLHVFYNLLFSKNDSNM